MDMQAQKPWLANYPPTVPASIDATAHSSLPELLCEAFRKHAARTACVCFDGEMKFADIDEMSMALGAWLQARDLTKGSRAAIMLPNLPQYMAAIAAVLRAGYTVVNVNPLYTARELEHQLIDSGARAIIVLENFANTLEAVIERTAVQHVVLASMGDLIGFWKGRLLNFAVRHVKRMVPEFSLPATDGRTVTRFRAAVAEGAGLRLASVVVKPDDVAFLQYTGGTTGVSKGATLLNRNVVANILQTEAWFRPVLDRVGDKPLTIVCALPLYHIFATICYMMGARLGAKNLLIPNPRHLPGLVRTFSKH